MKFPRTIRFDVSDANVFPLAAEPNEWAVTGTFAFADTDPSAFSNKEQLAFRNGWLGTGSFGRATFVQVAEISKDEFEAVAERLGGYLLDHFGAPDRETAVNAARGEAETAAGLCDHPPGTLLSIEREFTDTGIAERIRVLPEDEDASHAKIWEVVENDD